MRRVRPRESEELGQDRLVGVQAALLAIGMGIALVAEQEACADNRGGGAGAKRRPHTLGAASLRGVPQNVTIASASAAASASPGRTKGSRRLTAIGLPVSRRAAAISTAIGARTPAIVPRPPASDTAAASSCRATLPIPA